MMLGKVQGGSFVLTREDLLALPQHELTEQPQYLASLKQFRGPLLADVIEASDRHRIVRMKKGDVILTTRDGDTVTITADEMLEYGPILALDMDGQTLFGHELGPYVVMWPFKERPELDNNLFQMKAVRNVDAIEVQ